MPPFTDTSDTKLVPLKNAYLGDWASKIVIPCIYISNRTVTSSL